MSRPSGKPGFQTERKRRAVRYGALAEWLCRLILRLKGYRVLASRLRTKVGEIDILAERGQILAIIEVKARPTEAAALHAVSLSQRRRLERAALWVQHGDSRLANHCLRFDLFAVAHWRIPRHIQNAWTVDPNRQSDPMQNRLFFVLLLLIAPLGLGACTPVGVAIGAGATAATASQSERGLEGTAKDIALKTEINHYLFQTNVDLFSAVGLSVDDGRVLLTGSVEKPEDRIEAARLAWKADGVREVINEVQVVDKSDIIDKARDSWIETQLEAQLLFDGSIQSINYDIDTVNGTVYIFGIAQDNAEQQRVVNHARNIKYVRNVVSYVRIRGAS